MNWLLIIFSPAVLSGAAVDLQTIPFQTKALCDDAAYQVNSAGMTSSCVQVSNDSQEESE